MINFAINKAFNKYFDFGGRSNRSEFWYFFLFILIGNAIAHIIDTYMIGYHEEEMGIVSGIFWLVTFIPQLSITFRRLHDVGKVDYGFCFLYNNWIYSTYYMVVYYE